MDRRFRESGGVKVWTVVWCAFIVVFVVMSMAIFWTLADAKSLAETSSCQSNMTQICKAIRAYMTDWDDMYPTNRLGTGPKPLSYHVALSPWDGANGDKPKLFAGGRNWVESLYSYVEKVGMPGDNELLWRCPQAMRTTSDTASVSYALNCNLLEQPESAIRNPQCTMMVRELGLTADAECRPANLSDDPKSRPIGAFLTGNDPYLGACKADVHPNGSNILFADGHVANISRETMPTDDKLIYDKKTKQWWNGPAKIIAITP